jgi:hypothetical protein
VEDFHSAETWMRCRRRASEASFAGCACSGLSVLRSVSSQGCYIARMAASLAGVEAVEQYEDYFGLARGHWLPAPA